MASDIRSLNELQISRILTIDSCPLPDTIRHNPQIINKYIKANDVPTENILIYFSECLDFIDECIKNNNNVLVHW